MRLAIVLVALVTSSLSTLAVGPGVAWLINNGYFSSTGTNLYFAGVAIVGLSTLLGISTSIRYYNISWLGERVVAELRNELFQHLIKLDPELFERTDGIDIESRFTNDMQMVQNIAGSTISLALRNSIMVFGGIVAMMIMNFELTLFILVGIVCTVTPMIFFARRIRSKTKIAQDKVADVGSNMHEVAVNIKTVQGFNRQEYHTDKFDKTVEAAFITSKNAIFSRAFMMACAICVISLTMTVMIFYGIHNIRSGSMNSGDLIGFIFLTFIVTGSGTMLVESISEFMRAAGAMDRLITLFDLTPQTIQAARSAIASSEQIEKEELISDFLSSGNINIVDVSFSYNARPDIEVLEKINLSFEPNSHTVLIGKSGSGKSTLFDLILQFYSIDQGAILFDGINSRSIDLDTLRSQIGLVRQESPILKGTIAENILYGKPKATEEELLQAIADTQLDDFVKMLPSGIQTQVGTGGVALSGGQRQRISLARTIIAKPKILLLDEISSGLDVSTAEKINHVIDNLRGSCTIIESAHRLRVFDNQQIVLMEAGKIAEQGTHTTLLETSDFYRELFATMDQSN